MVIVYATREKSRLPVIARRVSAYETFGRGTLHQTFSPFFIFQYFSTL